MEKANNHFNLVILDACRDNPVARSFRSASRGLAQMNAPTGTLIAYATAPGMTAADGEGSNGLYTSELLRAMGGTGLKVEEVFKQVRASVQKKSDGRQVPWESSSLVGDFYFFGPVTIVAPGFTPSGDEVSKSAEVEFWKAIKDSPDPADFEAYLEKFPKGTFAALAHKKRLNALKKSQPAYTEGETSQKKPATVSGDKNYFEKARASYEAKNYTEAVKWSRKAAEQGDAFGQTELGLMYQKGLGVKHDYAQAFHWYRKAAEQGDALSQYNLGFMYDKGYGVERDYAQAFHWYRKAAEQGNAPGQYNLGMSYYDGHGVKQDYAQAAYWVRKAKETAMQTGDDRLIDYIRQSEIAQRLLNSPPR